MRLSIAFALVAATALAACSDGTATKGANSARAPIGAPADKAPAPVAAATPAPSCPPVKTACPPAKAKTADARVAAAKAWTAQRKPQARRAATRQVKASAAGASGPRYAHADAGVGLPTRPYRYDELRPSHEHDRGYERRRYKHRHYEGRGHGHRHADDYATYEERYVEGPVYRHEERRVEVRPLPPAHDGRRYAERHDERIDGSTRSEGVYRSERYSESYSETRSSTHVVQPPCCAPQAAGLDARGYLTWPGKVPAR